MRFTGKIAFLFFLFVFFILVFPLYAEPFSEPLPDYENSEDFTPVDDFIEELFVFDETFSDTEDLTGYEDIEFHADQQPGLVDDPFEFDDSFFFEAPSLIIEVPKFEIRSFDTIFPDFSREQRRIAMGNEGLRNYFRGDESATLIPNPDLGIDIIGSTMSTNPSHLIEAVIVVPYNERELDLLDIYNALGRIENIKDFPASFNGNDFHVFTESTRLDNSRNRRSIPDPPPSLYLPFSETFYLRLREFSMGNLFIRADISICTHAITYKMTNFLDVRYFLIPLMRAERFSTIIYLEPVSEGILIYSVSGFYLPGFIADRVNLTPNINRRLQIFIDWITDGLREQENAVRE